MSKEISDQTLEISGDLPPSSPESGDPAVSRTNSSKRLNARAPEFVPRAAPARQGAAPPAMHHVFHPAPHGPMYYVPTPPALEYYWGGGGGGFGEHESSDPEPSPAAPSRDGLSDEVIQKVTKQVEYYFSDLNLATTEHLMRFMTKDPEGFVPISVIASFNKIKALVHDNSELAMALRTSSKLIVSDDGKKVRCQEPFTESDMEELQARIVVAENLPEDHCHQNLMKVFSAVGSVKTIRTCYPQTTNGSTAPNNRSKHDVLFGNRLHAFVEYNTIEDAEKAVAELNDEKNWRNGLRVRLLPKCLVTKHGHGRVRKEHEVELTAEEDVSSSIQPNEKHVEDPIQQYDACHENLGDENSHDKEGPGRRGRGRGRGGRARGRGQHHNNSRGGGHQVGTPPSTHPVHLEQSAVVHKQPPGPRMPDGTRGFTMGRGKPLTSSNTV